MKKKHVLLIGLIGMVFILSGCGRSSEKTMTCSRTLNQSGIKTSLEYVITYQDSYVNRIKSKETIQMDDDSLLEQYKEQVEAIYTPYKDVKYYTYNVSIEDHTLISTADIDYAHIDTDKLIEIDSANSSLIKNGKISISDMKSVYEQLGATCK